MKRKKISLLCALLSIFVAVTYVALAVVLLSRVMGAKSYVPTATSDIWIIKVLKRLKEAGFNLFFSIMGMILSGVLALYRLMLAYFYSKVSKSDDTFYKARLGEIIFFSILSGFVIGVTAWLSFGLKGALPVEVQPFILVLFIAYLLLCALPILEIVLVYLLKAVSFKPIQQVPTKTGVVQELDELADKTALAIAQMQEEKKAQEEEKEQIAIPVQAKPIIQASIPRVRKVLEYVIPYWDREDGLMTEEISRRACTKLGIRKKNRKPSYNSATLRISKPISRKKRLQIVSPAKIKLRYQKTCMLERCEHKKRK